MKKLNIQEYIEDVDSNYSGANGYGDYDPAAVPNPDMYFSGAAGQAMPQQNLAEPDPFEIIVQNTTAGDLTAILFGKNKYGQQANYGSAPALIITTGFSNVSYLQLLEQSATEPFETSRMRIQSSNVSQVTKTFQVHVNPANGDSATKQVLPQNYFSEMQYQGTIVTIPRSFIFDGNTYMEAVILAGATVTYTFFPREMVKTTRALGAINQAPLKKFSNPPILVGTQGYNMNS